MNTKKHTTPNLLTMLSSLDKERASLLLSKLKDESIAKNSCNWSCAGHNKRTGH